MLSFVEFKNEIVNALEGLEDVSEVKVQVVEKNNGVVLTGVQAIKEGCNISPTMYIEDMYEEYNEHQDLDKCKETAINTYHRAMQGVKFADLSYLMDFDKIKNLIYPKVVNYDLNNNGALEKIPHRRVADLMVEYIVILPKSQMTPLSRGTSSILIHTQMMEHLKVDEETLYQTALENMRKQGYKFKSMIKMFEEDFNSDLFDEGVPVMKTPELYVLTNETYMFGASAILDTRYLEAIRLQVGDFYILPSSVHEVIIAPFSLSPDSECLKMMVPDVNDKCVDEQEVLSSNVYVFDGELKIA